MEQTERYFIPDIVIVGFGRTQTYQHKCIKCKKLTFNMDTNRRDIDNLFCDSCVEKLGNLDKIKLLKDTSISEEDRLGNVVGWEMRMCSARERRERRNYNKVLVRDNYTCQYCGYSPDTNKEFRQLHIDHIKPWAAGGGNDVDNLVVACAFCNQHVGSKWFDSFAEKKAHIKANFPNKLKK